MESETKVKKEKDDGLDTYYFVRIVNDAGDGIFDSHLCKTKEEAENYRTDKYPPLGGYKRNIKEIKI